MIVYCLFPWLETLNCMRVVALLLEEISLLLRERAIAPGNRTCSQVTNRLQVTYYQILN